MKRRVYAATAALVFLFSCGSFIKKTDIPQLKEYEKKEYTLKQDVSQAEVALKKGQRVRLHVITGDDMVKVYCFAADLDILKADRVLILYLFEDDFPKKELDLKFFEEKLFAIVETR